MTNIKQSKKKTKAKRAEPSKSFQSLRKRLDKKRLTRELSTHWAHFWNVCPKCGGDMFEQKIKSIFFDVCRKCHGIHMDVQELDAAVQMQDPDKLLKSIIRKSKKPSIKIK